MLKNCKECNKEISTDAKKCSHCGKELRNWFMRHKIITFIGSIIIIGIIGNATGGDKTTNTSANTSTPAQTQLQGTSKPQEGQTKAPEQVMTISAEDLAKAFKDNEIKANGQYKDKKAKITDKIRDMGEALGYKYIILSNGKDFEITDVQCFFEDKNEVSKIANLNKGDTVSVIGLLYYVFQRGDIPLWARRTITGALGYFILPLDVIPDLIPGGLTDDLGILVAALVSVAMFIDEDVKAKARNKLKDWFGEYDESYLDEIENKIKNDENA